MFQCSQLPCLATCNTILAMISGMHTLLYWIRSIWFPALSPCPQQRHLWRLYFLSTIYGGKASLPVSLLSLLWGVLTGPMAELSYINQTESTVWQKWKRQTNGEKYTEDRQSLEKWERHTPSSTLIPIPPRTIRYLLKGVISIHYFSSKVKLFQVHYPYNFSL